MIVPKTALIATTISEQMRVSSSDADLLGPVTDPKRQGGRRSMTG